MALRALRLRLSLSRALTALPSISRPLSSPNPLSAYSCSPFPAARASDSLSASPEFSHCRSFRSSAALLSSNRQYKLYKEGDEIDENTILFEGCDYNHWLIVVDFPRDKPKPPAEEMIQIYERICAEGLGVSIEEAKKRIYACSTTVYEGFQVEMTEEASKKFEDVPGVVFVLPDSYIDPVNKQYGGDKYENGVITPRPLPAQYANNNRRRPRDRNDRGRYDQQGRQTQSWQQNPPYNHQGQAQGDGRNFGPQQGYPAQSYGSQRSVNNDSYTTQPAMNNQSYRPPQQQSMNSQTHVQEPPMNSQTYVSQSPTNSQNYGMPPSMSNQNYQGDGSGTSPPVYRGNFSQGGQSNYLPQQQMGQGNVAPSGPVASPRFGQGTNTSYGQGNWQGTNPGSGQGTSHGYIRQVPGQGTNPGSGHGVGPSYGQNYSQGENPGYGHGINTGGGQGPSPGYNSQVPGQGVNPSFGQGGDPSYGQRYGQGADPGYAHEDGQRLPHTEQSSPIGPAGTVQGKF